MSESAWLSRYLYDPDLRRNQAYKHAAGKRQGPAIWKRYALAALNDEITDFWRWPQWLRNLYLKEHKNRQERWDLFVILTKNGVHPDVACNSIMIDNSVYDEKAIRQMYEIRDCFLQKIGRCYWNQWNKRVYMLSEKVYHPDDFVYDGKDKNFVSVNTQNNKIIF